MLKLKTFPNAAGKRRTLVTIQKASDADANTIGEVLPEHLTEFHRWTEEMLTSGIEFQAAMTTIANLRGVLRLPYDSKTRGITARDRITIGDRVLQVAGKPFDDGGRHETMIVYVIEPELPNEA